MQKRSFLLVAALALSSAGHAHDYKLQDLHIDHPYARATAPQQPSAGAFLTIENQGKAADKLISADSPVAKSVQIHTMSMEGNVMKMREVGSIELQPGAKIEMQPGGGHHLMLIGLQRPLKAGDEFPLTLNFEKAGKTEVTVKVEGFRKGSMDGHGMQHGH